ncbi:FGGY-family carbohydrate kinase [Sinorhizobium sp. BG8]|uniref:FGGY-family carbohydrate kinase n=1 Tax=Sinorhizobium sp. BG8 TaxID=2613773 RepID=UPI00193E0E38|nr:FGGY-family carbohydrate kinase [Sinorhizobium sp. BG8]QRM54204.1 carbohydrate kinase [Sinorhizobium sp. BG8]
MADVTTIAVVDIGKTNAKVALVDAATFQEIAVRTTPNLVVTGPPYPHFDTERLWAFIVESLGSLNAERRIDAVSVTTHGATAALVDADGRLALPVLDYEYAGPDELDAEYRKARPPFAASGTPRLPGGLNLGAQIYWQSRRFPDAFANTASLLMYAQYWSFRLTGVLAGEVTSLGCHTDLWEPLDGRYSTLVTEQGWLERMPPLRKAGDSLGPILPDVAARTGLDAGTPVYCGIHDSNASLLPYVLSLDAPYAVVSTGTWVIVMAMGGKRLKLDEARDTLVNVNALGNPVPSARFMGGRAFSLLGGRSMPIADAAVTSVLARASMILPSVPEDSGPFQGKHAEWTVARDELSEEEVQATIAFHLALMTSTCLGLIGAEGPVIVEGPFASNPAYLAMLKASTGREILTGASVTGTSAGAACLAAGNVAQPRLQPFGRDSSDEMKAYAEAWASRALR